MKAMWTIDQVTPENNMARFKKKMQNLFKKYDQPFENSVLVNLETMTYDTPNGPKPWKGEITCPIKVSRLADSSPPTSKKGKRAGLNREFSPSGITEGSLTGGTKVSRLADSSPPTSKKGKRTGLNREFSPSGITEGSLIGGTKVSRLVDSSPPTSKKGKRADLNREFSPSGITEGSLIGGTKVSRLADSSPPTPKKGKRAGLNREFSPSGITEGSLIGVTKELTVPATSAINNETFIVSSDNYPGDFKLMITPMTDKRGCVPLRSMSELEIGKTYSVDLDFLIEDESLPKSYELTVTQEHSESMCLPKKSCRKEGSFDCQHAKLNNIESPRNNGTFAFICSANGKQQRHISGQSERLSQSTGSCEPSELADERNVEEIASNSIHAAKEELNTSQKTITSVRDVCPGLVKHISGSMNRPMSRPSVSTKTNIYESNGVYCKSTKLNICRRKAIGSTILKSRLKTTEECSTLNPTSNQTRSQRLKCSPHHFDKTYFPHPGRSVSESNENACADSLHGESTLPLVERPGTSLVSDGGSKTDWTILKPEFPLKKGTNMGNPPSLEIDEQYEADLSGSLVASRKAVDKKSQYSYVCCPIAQPCVCENYLAAAVTSNANIQAHNIYCSESAGCPNCKPSQYLTQRATAKTFAKIPFVTQQTHLAGNVEVDQAGCPITKHTSKQYCSPCPPEEVKRNKFDILKMTEVYVNRKKNIALKDEKNESAFDQMYRKLCLESNSQQVPLLKRASFSTKNLDSSDRSNALTSSLSNKTVKRDSDFQDDDTVVPNGKRLKSRNVSLNSSEIGNYLFGGVNSPALEKSPEYLHSSAKWLKKCYTDGQNNKQHPTRFPKTNLTN